MKRIILTLALTIPFLSFGDSSSLEGVYWVDGQILIDAPENQANDTHIYFRLDGDAAKDLYRLIDAEPEWDKCGTDHWEKRKEKIVCEFYEEEEEYCCYFSINIDDETVWYGPPC